MFVLGKTYFVTWNWGLKGKANHFQTGDFLSYSLNINITKNLMYCVPNMVLQRQTGLEYNVNKL